MAEDFSQLRSDLQRIVSGPVPGDGPGVHEPLLEVMRRLDALASAQSTPDRLRHYLSRRSYLKALHYLDDPSVPHHP